MSKLNLTYVVSTLAEYPMSGVDELLPWYWRENNHSLIHWKKSVSGATGIPGLSTPGNTTVAPQTLY